jgi:hypothetical protein
VILDLPGSAGQTKTPTDCCASIFRVIPGVVAAGVPSAEASVAINPDTAQIPQERTPVIRGSGLTGSLFHPPFDGIF